MSFLVDGELISRTKSTATAFSRSPKEAAWTCATASPAFWSVWRHRCGRCRPLCARIIKSPSAGVDSRHFMCRGSGRQVKLSDREISHGLAWCPIS